MDITNLENPEFAPEFSEISNLSIRTSSKKKIGEAGDISFSRLSRWGLRRKIRVEFWKKWGGFFENMELPNFCHK